MTAPANGALVRTWTAMLVLSLTPIAHGETTGIRILLMFRARDR